MDQPQYNSLVEALASVPDPRHARGKQLEWAFLLGLIVTALLCQQRGAGIPLIQWTHRYAACAISGCARWRSSNATGLR